MEYNADMGVSICLTASHITNNMKSWSSLSSLCKRNAFVHIGVRTYVEGAEPSASARKNCTAHLPKQIACYLALQIIVSFKFICFT